MDFLTAILTRYSSQRGLGEKLGLSPSFKTIKYILIVLLLASLLGFPSKTSSYEQPPSRDRQKIDLLISQKADQYGVSVRVLTHIVSKESRYAIDAVGDKAYVCPRTKDVAPSYGLVQISSCWHPEIAIADSLNPEFAIDFLARSVAKGRCKQWSTCQSL